MDALRQDLQYALRLLAKSPGFAAAAILMLAVGVGVNTALFSVVEGVLLRPLPFEEADRLVFITREGDVSIPDGADWRAACPSFEHIALFLRGWSFDLVGDGEPQRLNGAVVEPDFFGILRTPPLLGRTLQPEDNRTGASHVAVLSYGLWRRKFGGAPDVLGRTLVLSDNATTVVGVMPAEFDFLHDEVDFWIAPAAAVPFFIAERGTNNFDAIGRLKQGATIEQARAELLAISRRLEAEYPRTNRGKIVDPLPMLEFIVGGARRALVVLAAAVGLVMIVAASNLAGLLLARSTARRGEFALRLAIGSGRGRLLGQLLVEGLVLAAFGATLGLLAAGWTRDLLLGIAPDSVPRAWEVRTDLRALAFGLGLATLAGLLASLAPAVAILGRDPAAWLKTRDERAGRGSRGVLGVLVASEVAMAFLLLFGAGLLARTFGRLNAVGLGFEPAGVIKGDLVLPESRYGNREAQTRMFTTAVENLAATPGVEAAGYATTTPLDPRGSLGGTLLFVDMPPRPPEGGIIGARVRLVHGDYFEALRMALREGRFFTLEDDASAEPVVIVNERFARELWPQASPLGKRIAYRDFHDGEPFAMTIVGVVRDVKGATLDGPDTRTVYSPYVQRRVEWQRWGALVARTRVDPAGFGRQFQQAVWRVDPAVPLENVETLEQKRVAMLAPQRFNAAALGLFAAVALGIAAQGLYALLAYAVELRRREIGVRMALGAGRGDVARIVVGGGVGLAVAGLTFGVVASLGLQRVVQSLLFEVEPGDPLTYASVALGLLLTALLAAALPAVRAARTDPAEVLRSE
ncbi:MAG TPA: ABC transporter permease [Vicinamibacteria bacterium]|nr:ABC transporter permease [Vicinamibacteria bacterium]